MCDLAISFGWEIALKALDCPYHLSEPQIRLRAELAPRFGWGKAYVIARHPHRRSSRISVMIAYGAQAAADLPARFAAASERSDRMWEEAQARYRLAPDPALPADSSAATPATAESRPQPVGT